jgi:hypothetical protein
LNRRSDADKERLLRIIGLCVAVENRGGDPFEVEVREILDTMRRYLSNWKALDDFVLDSETLRRIAGIVQLQGEWVKRRSTSLFIDPLLIEVKLKLMDTQRLLDLFQKSWHPAVEMEELSRTRVEQAIDYWNQLSTIDERRLKLPESSGTLGSVTAEELIRRNILSEESFRKTLESLWQELKNTVGQKRRILYWDFVQQKTYNETVKRAYFVSYLITYGYATMQINPLEEEVFLIPNEEVAEPTFGKQALTIPIAIDRVAWKRRTENKK